MHHGTCCLNFFALQYFYLKYMDNSIYLKTCGQLNEITYIVFNHSDLLIGIIK